MTDYSWNKSESRRTAYERKKEEREAKARDAETLIENLDEGEQPPQGLLSVGKGEERLAVPDGCIGMIIGKKGENLKRVEARWKVKVELQKDSSNRVVAIVVAGRQCDVAAARRELDFAHDTIDVDPQLAGWVCGRSGENLKQIRELSGVASLNLCREKNPRPAANGVNKHDAGDGDESRELTEPRAPSDAVGAEGRCWLELRGLRECVSNARMCLETHMEYHPVYVEMSEAKRKLDQDLQEAQAQVGWRPGSTSRGSDRGQGAGRGTDHRAPPPANSSTERRFEHSGGYDAIDAASLEIDRPAAAGKGSRGRAEDGDHRGRGNQTQRNRVWVSPSHNRNSGDT